MAIRDRAALQAAIFRRLATGSGNDRHAIVIADHTRDHDDALELDSAPEGVQTARQRIQIKQALFYWRETQRQISGMTKRAAHREGVNDTGSAYQWKPTRPARRAFA